MPRRTPEGLNTDNAGWIEWDLRLADQAITRATQYVKAADIHFEDRKVNTRRLNAARVFVDRVRKWARGGKGE